MVTFGRVMTAGLLALTGAIGSAHGQQEAVQEDVGAEAQPQTEIRRVSQILGAQVVNQAGEQIGKVADWVMDHSGRPKYVLIGLGGVAGVGEERVAVPVSQANVGQTDDGDQFVRVQTTRETLEGAPRVSGEYQQFRDANWREKNDAYFEVEQDASAVEGDATELIGASQLFDANVENPTGEDIADIKDLILDREFQATYAIVGAGGVLGIGEDRIPIPFDSLSLTYNQENDDYVVTLNTTREQLEQAPRIEGENYNALNEPEFRDEVDRYYITTEQPE